MIVDLFEFDLDEVLVRLRNELLQPLLDLLELSEILKTILHQSIRIINLLSFVNDVKSFYIFAFFVAKNLFFLEHPLCASLCTTNYRGLSMPTLTFYKYLSFAREFLAFFSKMTNLFAFVSTIRSFFFTFFEASFFIGFLT